MSDPEVLLAEEARMVGRPCTLLGHTALDVGGRRVETLVYEAHPRPEDRHPTGQHRWAVFVEGACASSCIVRSWSVGA